MEFTGIGSGGGNSNGYSHLQMSMYDSKYPNDINNTYYDIGGQIMAHFG